MRWGGVRACSIRTRPAGWPRPWPQGARLRHNHVAAWWRVGPACGRWMRVAAAVPGWCRGVLLPPGRGLRDGLALVRLCHNHLADGSCWPQRAGRPFAIKGQEVGRASGAWFQGCLLVAALVTARSALMRSGLLLPDESTSLLAVDAATVVGWVARRWLGGGWGCPGRSGTARADAAVPSAARRSSTLLAEDAAWGVCWWRMELRRVRWWRMG